jgi:hypothetical protein
MRSVLPVALALLVAGCSFVGATPPGRRTFAGGEPDCTSSSAAPTIDTLAAVALIVGGSLLFSADCHSNEEEDSGVGEGLCKMASGMAGTVAILGGVGYGASALYGAGTVSDCREAKRTHRGRPTIPPVALVPTPPR